MVTYRLAYKLELVIIVSIFMIVPMWRHVMTEKLYLPLTQHDTVPVVNFVNGGVY